MQKAPLGNTVGNAWLMTWENHTATLCSDLTFLLSAPHGWKRRRPFDPIYGFNGLHLLRVFFQDEKQATCR